jgi:hypothetical protein
LRDERNFGRVREDWKRNEGIKGKRSMIIKGEECKKKGTGVLKKRGKCQKKRRKVFKEKERCVKRRRKGKKFKKKGKEVQEDWRVE